MIGTRLIREPFRAMGTECAVAATAGPRDDARARRALTAARREIETCERVLSRFLPESDLSCLNRAGGRWTVVDGRLLAALRVALHFRNETNGAFDPTILPALVAARRPAAGGDRLGRGIRMRANVSQRTGARAIAANTSPVVPVRSVPAWRACPRASAKAGNEP